MPTDIQMHDTAWAVVTTVGYTGLFGIYILFVVVCTILWQVNCFLREKVLALRKYNANQGR